MKNEAKIRENTDKLIKFVYGKFMNDELDNDSLVELFKDIGSYLNLKTVSEYARVNNMSYEGVKKCRRVERIFVVRFVIEND